MISDERSFLTAASEGQKPDCVAEVALPLSLNRLVDTIVVEERATEVLTF